MKAAHVRRHIALVCFVTLSLPALVAAFASGPAASPDASSKQAVVNYGKLPLAFEANEGQPTCASNFFREGAGTRCFSRGMKRCSLCRDQGPSVKGQERRSFENRV